MKKTLAPILLIVCSLLLAGCGASGAPGQSAKLSFSQSASMDTIRSLDGKEVNITGYMATLSPLDGSYIYLMNLPYQSCPFCVPNTQQLSNTMAVYAAKGVTFSFTDRPVKITGTLQVSDTVDDYGYTYNYRIVNARYEPVDLSAVSEEYALYQSLAEDGVIADVNAMFDYLMFVCQWTEYQSSYLDDAGNKVTFNLYAGDVERMLTDEGPYGYATQSADSYFPALIQRVRAVNAAKLEELVQIITDAQTVEKYARSELENGQYAYDEATDKFTLTHDADLYEQFRAVYLRFSQWLTQYEL